MCDTMYTPGDVKALLSFLPDVAYGDASHAPEVEDGEGRAAWLQKPLQLAQLSTQYLLFCESLLKRQNRSFAGAIERREKEARREERELRGKEAMIERLKAEIKATDRLLRSYEDVHKACRPGSPLPCREVGIEEEEEERPLPRPNKVKAAGKRAEQPVQLQLQVQERQTEGQGLRSAVQEDEVVAFDVEPALEDTAREEPILGEVKVPEVEKRVPLDVQQVEVVESKGELSIDAVSGGWKGEEVVQMFEPPPAAGEDGEAEGTQSPAVDDQAVQRAEVYKAIMGAEGEEGKGPEAPDRARSGSAVGVVSGSGAPSPVQVDSATVVHEHDGLIIEDLDL